MKRQRAIPLSKPSLGIEDQESVRRAIESGWITQNGSDVKLMETTLENYFRNKTQKDEFVCKSVSNGTTALHLALLAAGVEKEDEVIVPNFAYAAVVNSVLYCGATPVLVDVNYDTWNLEMESVLEAVTNRTKAIIIVDNYGKISDYSRLRASIDPNIRIIRDACESFPFKDSKYELSFNDFITNSFYANKIITSAEGGAIFGPLASIELISILRNQGVEQPGSFAHTMLGYNFRISNLHAALFNSQWLKMETLISRRSQIFSQYEEFFSRHFPHVSSNANATPWLFTVRFNSNEARAIREVLRQHNIETRPGFTPFHKFPYLTKYAKSGYFNSEALSKRIVSFPTYPELSDSDLNIILSCLSRYKIGKKY